MSNTLTLTLQVDVRAGVRVHDVMVEMCELARQLNIYVRADVNGVTVLAGPGVHSDDLLEAYQHELRRADEYRIAVARDRR